MRASNVLGVTVVVLAAAVAIAIATRTPPPAAPVPAPPAPGPAMGGGPHGRIPMDAFTKAVMTYPVTMERLEDYVAAVREIRAAGEADPALMAKLRVPRKPGDMPADIAARVDQVGPVKVILDRHGLAAIDLVLMPRAVAAGQYGYALEQEGRPPPADQTNPGAVALYRADLPRMDAIAKAFRADLAALDGR